MAEYPNFDCRQHGTQPCYPVCEHIITGTAAVSLIDHPDADPGLILCSQCQRIPRPIKDINGSAPVCTLCAAELGWTTPRQ
jgi:hypothetical protein